MAEKKFLQLLSQYPKAIQHYCEALGWDYEKFKTSISDEGISHPDLYLEDPNEGIIENISQFLEPSNQSSVLIIWDEVGMGKSSIRDFVSKSLDEVGSYHTVVITDPRLTPLQLLRAIAVQIDAKVEVWNDRGKVKEALWERMREVTEAGVNIVIWVDEAERIDRDIISELRALSDLKTEEGAKLCKIILSGTPRLREKLDRYMEEEPEDAIAFDDRASLNTFRLNRWSADDIYKYWTLLAEYCGGANPFTREASETLYEISEGKPRTIAQITKLAINQKAMEYYTKGVTTEITSEFILTAIKRHLGERSA
jgi:type II secretory pathway predicted ATPase ExeA